MNLCLQTALRGWAESWILRIMILCSLKTSSSFVPFHKEWTWLCLSLSPSHVGINGHLRLGCFLKYPLKMNEKKLKMMRYLRKNYHILSYSASKNLESLCSEFISIVNGGKGVYFLNQMNSCYLQVTNLMQLKCNSKGNLISSNLPSDNCSHLQSASFMIFSPCSYPIFIWSCSLQTQHKPATSLFQSSLLLQVPPWRAMLSVLRHSWVEPLGWSYWRENPP